MPELFGCLCLPLVRELGAAGRHGVTGAALRSAGLALRPERLPRRIETAPAKRKRYGPERARPESFAPMKKARCRMTTGLSLM